LDGQASKGKGDQGPGGGSPEGLRPGDNPDEQKPRFSKRVTPAQQNILDHIGIAPGKVDADKVPAEAGG